MKGFVQSLVVAGCIGAATAGYSAEAILPGGSTGIPDGASAPAGVTIG
jgi:hypothetical protein